VEADSTISPETKLITGLEDMIDPRPQL